MNFIIEKEKKLSLALSELKKLNLKNPDLQSSIENLNDQKNQLEIEKKEIITKYQNLLQDYDLLKTKLEEINNQKKNQLEIEKEGLEDKYRLLKEDYDSLSKKLEEMKGREKLEERKHIEFSEKIDELNQETDTLLDEIDKWQT